MSVCRLVFLLPYITETYRNMRIGHPGEARTLRGAQFTRSHC